MLCKSFVSETELLYNGAAPLARLRREKPGCCIRERGVEAPCLLGSPRKLTPAKIPTSKIIVYQTSWTWALFPLPFLNAVVTDERFTLRKVSSRCGWLRSVPVFIFREFPVFIFRELQIVDLRTNVWFCSHRWWHARTVGGNIFLKNMSF